MTYFPSHFAVGTKKPQLSTASMSAVACPDALPVMVPMAVPEPVLHVTLTSKIVAMAVTSVPADTTVPNVVPVTWPMAKPPPAMTSVVWVQLVIVRLDIGPATPTPVKVDDVPRRVEPVHVSESEVLSVLVKSIEVPGSRLASIVTALFCVTPATSSVVAEALLGANPTMAMANRAAKQCVFRCLTAALFDAKTQGRK
jgi:hypothetical protein